MKITKINDESFVPLSEYETLKKQVNKKVGTSKRFVIGKTYFIRTATYHYTGEVVDLAEDCVFLTKVCWIADSGRFSQFIQGETDANESEPYSPEAIVPIPLAWITDSTERKLILLQK